MKSNFSDMIEMVKRIGLVVAFALNLILVAAQAPGTVFPSGTFGVDYNTFNSSNKREGVWIRVYKSNPKVMYYKGIFKNGVPTGIFEFYNDKGLLKSTVNHVQDTTVNDVVNYYADGKTVNSKGRYVGKKVAGVWQRQKQGRWEFFDDEGRLIRFENYKDNLLNGESKVYFANGQVSHEMIYINDKLNGPFAEYTIEGKVSKKGGYKDGVYDGSIVVNYDSGNKKEEGKFINGMHEGAWNFYLETGLPELTIWFKSDKIEKKHYANGTFQTYYDSGIPQSEYTYKNYNKEGAFAEYYDKGTYEQIPASPEDVAQGIMFREQLKGTQVKQKGKYVNGQLSGEVLYFKISGELEKTEVYENGKLKETK
jgi:antitoxin component YwqK of YwqJK toxin-antitoxin module